MSHVHGHPEYPESRGSEGYPRVRTLPYGPEHNFNHDIELNEEGWPQSCTPLDILLICLVPVPNVVPVSVPQAGPCPLPPPPKKKVENIGGVPMRGGNGAPSSKGMRGR